jgi:FtsZ-binding cell division protein ZapB
MAARKAAFAELDSKLKQIQEVIETTRLSMMQDEDENLKEANAGLSQIKDTLDGKREAQDDQSSGGCAFECHLVRRH